MGKKQRRWWLVTVAATALISLIGVAYAAILRPHLLRHRQIQTHAHCQGIDARLGQHFSRTGRYPIDVGDVLTTNARARDLRFDPWGGELFYESDGTMFLLVSYGRDGVPDGSDYRALRALGSHPEGYDICGNYDADEVMSDVGWHRLCGK